MMKKSFLLTVLAISGMSLLPSIAVADNNNEPAQVKDLCGDHARNVIEVIHSEIFQGMTADQYRQTESLIIDDCLQRFASGEAVDAKTAGSAEENTDDWFTRYVLEGKGADKPGNRRLERLRRK